MLSIKSSKNISAQRQAENFQSRRLLERYEAEMSDNPPEDVLEGYLEVKRRVDQIENESGQRAMLYSGARCMKQGKNHKIFFICTLKEL